MNVNWALRPRVICNAGDMSQASITSEAIDLNHLSHAAFQAIWTGDAVGLFTVEGSLDGQNFGTITDLEVQGPAGVDGSRLINIFGMAIRFLRFKYTRTSGSGSLTVWACAKGA